MHGPVSTRAQVTLVFPRGAVGVDPPVEEAGHGGGGLALHLLTLGACAAGGTDAPILPDAVDTCAAVRTRRWGTLIYVW